MALRIWSSFFGYRRPRSGDLPRRAAEAVSLRREQSGGVVVSDHPAHSPGPPQAVMVQEPGRPAAGDRFDRGVARGRAPGTTVRTTRETAQKPKEKKQKEQEAPDHEQTERGGKENGPGDRRDARRPAGHGVD